MKITQEDVAMLVRITDELKFAATQSRNSGDGRVAGRRMGLRTQLKEFVVKLELRRSELSKESDAKLVEQPFA
jgi:hypothetical protein